jgi:hypothetical protein
MFAAARGGLGGTNGARAAGVSQASAVLTFGLTKKGDGIGIARSYQGPKSGRHEGAGSSELAEL